MLRLLKEGLIVLLTIITKSFIDGYHEDSEIKCFFATMTIIGNLIILVSSIRLYKKIKVGMTEVIINIADSISSLLQSMALIYISNYCTKKNISKKFKRFNSNGSNFMGYS